MVYETKSGAAKRKTESLPKNKSKKSTRLEIPQEQLVIEQKSLKEKYDKVLEQAGLSRATLDFSSGSSAEKNVWSEKIFGSEKILGRKICWSVKFLGQKKNVGNKF